MSRTRTLVASLAALAALALGGSAIAGAVDNSDNGKSGQNGTQQQQWRGHDGDGRGPHGGPGMGEQPLTGDTAAKVKAAAEAKVDGGTVIRTETDRGGVYEAHVRTKDGQEVVVKVDKSFKVTGTEQLSQGGRGPHGPGMGEQPLTGDTAKKVKAAAEAKVDGGTVIRTETDRGGVYEAHVRTKDGQEVVVKVDKSFKVTGTEQLGQGGPQGPQGQGGPQGVAYGAPMSTQAS